MDKTYRSVWDALYDDPNEANDLKKRSDYLILIAARLLIHPGPLAERTKHFGLTANQVSDLQNRRINNFSLPELIVIARKIGITAKL